ncbi:MAG TPA: methyltransferase domain-containing protein [Solirubrobacterales bacterium]|nr:methyltransferase domain-containing protein [Solirubrobacterales bacterium]
MTEDILESHLERQAEKSQSFFWNRLRWELISSHLPDGPAELVDVGAGVGFLGDFLRERQPQIQYRFVEPLAGLEQQLTERFGAESNRRDRDFGEAGFVTLMDVLEHQRDDRAFMAELAAKMRPGSTLLLTVPAMPSLWSDWDAMLGHFRRYTKASLRGAVDTLPLEVVEVSYLFPELVPLAWVRRLRLRSDGAGDAADAEFPDLPPALNEALYKVGKGTVAGRRFSPVGSSLFAVIRRSA